MTSAEFVHLHVHSEYSILDGIVRMKDLCQKAKEYGMPAVAVTDHGNMYGTVEFYKTALAHGIKPIIGCEVYLAARSHLDENVQQDKKSSHLTLLAKDLEGYHNLIKLVSISHQYGFYYKPRVDLELLAKYSRGLICLSGCLTGPLCMYLSGRSPHPEPLQVVERLAEIFVDNFYIELQDLSIADQKAIIPGVIKFAKDRKLPLVLTNDVHFINQQDAAVQDAAVCIQTGKLLSDQNRMKMDSQQMYFKSPAEMLQLFPDLPEAARNTLEIAERCNLNLNLNQSLLPNFDVSPGYTLDSYLQHLSFAGLQKKYVEITKPIHERYVYELEMIKRMGFSGYFLVVQDFINWARTQGIQVGPGRGSAAGSIVAYALGITDIEPLRYHLLFERFLNPERVSMPDIDIDFCYRRRGEVIKYVTQKYGEERVAQIVTFGTMAARAAIRDVGRVQNVPLNLVDKIAKLVPATPGTTLDQAMETIPEFAAFYNSDRQIKSLIDTAKALEGMVRHSSTHAAGVVISKDPLDEIVPIAMNEGQKVTQYQMTDLESIGLLKMDFLGLRNLTMIADSLDLIEKLHGHKIDFEHIPLTDKPTFDLLCQGDTVGVFQLESSGMRELIQELKPSCFEDIIALLALYRPGPLGSGMVSEFVSNKHGQTKVRYEIPQMEPILQETYGLILYQEQVMQIASQLGGFTLGQADMMRRAMGKKKMEEMERMKNDFLAGCTKNGIPSKQADKIFDLCAKFAEYGFNKSHSAAYAMISYRTAYLKANYPLEYMAALLTSILSSTDKVTQYINECQRMEIDILPPEINESMVNFSVEEGSIRFGLAAIKNVGEAAVESIVNERDKNGPFQNFDDFCFRMDLRVVNKRVLESLIKSGGFDAFGKRAAVFQVLDRAVGRASSRQKEQANGQISLFEFMATQTDTPHWEPEVLPEIAEWEPKIKLHYEKELLGLYISDHPLRELKDVIEAQTSCNIGKLDTFADGASVTIGGIIVSHRRIMTKTNKQMIIAVLEDMHGSVDLVIFPGRPYEDCSLFIENDGFILVTGRVKLEINGPKIICEAVKPLEIRSATYHIEISSDEPALMDELKNILQLYRGYNPVNLHYHGQKIVPGQAYWLNSDPVGISRIEELVGKGKIWKT